MVPIMVMVWYNWLTVCSASPLNAQAAELWDTDKEEYKRLVLARHRDVEDVE